LRTFPPLGLEFGLAFGWESVEELPERLVVVVDGSQTDAHFEAGGGEQFFESADGGVPAACFIGRYGLLSYAGAFGKIVLSEPSDRARRSE
jgi:hypothetical protein